MKSTSIAVAGLLLGGVTSGHAQNSESFDQRLKKLESEVQALRKENQELKSALADGKGGLIVVKPAGKEVSLKIGGLIQAQADFLDKGDSRWGSEFDRFYLRRARLNLTGNFLEHFDFKFELDLSGTLGESSGLRAQLTDGYINYNRLEWANLRVGQFKTPYGFEQLFSDPRLLTIERSLPNDRLTMGRQIGAMVAGDFIEKRISYASGIFNGNGLNTTANDNDNFMWVGRLSGVPWQGKLLKLNSSWGIGGAVFASDDNSITGMNDFLFDATPATAALDGVFAGYRTGASADTQFQIGPVEIWAEYFRTRFEPANEIPVNELEAEGWYTQAAYDFLPNKLQGVLKFESFDPNIDSNGNTTDIWTIGLNYYIKGHDLKAQLDYLYFDAHGEEDRQNKILVRLQSIF